MTSKRKARSEAGRAEFTVAVPGSAGSFSAIAANSYFNAHNTDLVGASSFKEVFQLVEEGKAKYGVLPVESSMSGSLQQTHDCLLQFNLFIVGECAQEEHHCLLAKRGTKKEQIKKVFSHSALHEQCNWHLEKLEETSKCTLERICVSDSIAGCKKVVGADNALCAAIASEEAAGIYGLEVLETNISNYKPMITRYVIISKTKKVVAARVAASRERLKTSICVSFGNAPGTFHKIFAAFGFRNINIDRLVSRPSSTALEMFTGPSLKHWDYVYHIDYEPPVDCKTEEALHGVLQEFCLVVRHFGTYPALSEKTSIQKSMVKTPMSPLKSALLEPANTSLFI